MNGYRAERDGETARDKQAWDGSGKMRTVGDKRQSRHERTERKRELRRTALLKRDALSERQRMEKSGQIAERLSAHPWYQEAEYLLVYASYLSEVSTEAIIRHALRAGKRVYCPVVTGKREMVFCALEEALADRVLKYGLSAMNKDRHGIPQPDAKACPHYDDQPQKSLMLMPGCVFDDGGNRIGYGGGFYDSFLAAHPMRTIALFFDCQHADVRIEAEPHDVPPDLILTESGFRTTGGVNNDTLGHNALSYGVGYFHTE